MVARATQDSLDLGWSDQPLSDTVHGSEETAVPLDNSDDDEPTRVAASAAAVVAPAVPADIDLEALDPGDIHEEGARLTEPGLAPPPPTSAEIAAAEAAALNQAAAVREAPVAAAEPAPVESRVIDKPRTAPPITNPPPVELGRAPQAAEPASMPAASMPAASMPAASIPPPPITPGYFTPASLAPTAADLDDFASPSLLATMKRTRPTSAWTGVGLFVAALTFVGGIGLGRSMTPRALPPVAVPAPFTASVAPASPSPTSTPSAITEPAAAPATPPAPAKPPAPFDAPAARAALDTAVNAANTCRATGDPKGTIPTTVTFAPSGTVSNVAINSSRYAGTKTARCITERLNEVHVAEFSGSPEALKRVVTVR
ncbi:MAG TPA: hypothetical protein VMI54_20890 [Polyangiaceae bacterium]|nr:hypothetical protein [Polyangiaceae bacterium]